MYVVVITYSDGFVEEREVFGRMRAYALYCGALRNPDVASAVIRGAKI